LRTDVNGTISHSGPQLPFPGVWSPIAQPLPPWATGVVVSVETGVEVPLLDGVVTVGVTEKPGLAVTVPLGGAGAVGVEIGTAAQFLGPTVNQTAANQTAANRDRRDNVVLHRSIDHRDAVRRRAEDIEYTSHAARASVEPSGALS